MSTTNTTSTTIFNKWIPDIEDEGDARACFGLFEIGLICDYESKRVHGVLWLRGTSIELSSTVSLSYSQVDRVVGNLMLEAKEMAEEMRSLTVPQP